MNGLKVVANASPFGWHDINGVAGPEYTITRGNNVYGPTQYAEKICPKFILRLLNNRKCCIHGNGSNKRHYLYVDDTVNAFDVILHKGTIGETYNIGSPYELTNLEVAKILIKIIKNEDPEKWIEYVDDRAFNDVRYYLSYDKLTKLGWEPQTCFEDGVKRTIEWLKSINPSEYWSPTVLNALEPHPCN